MPRAFTQCFLHLVFSTKHREPWITTDLEPRLFEFIGGILRDLGCSAVAINGAPDHIHLLVQAPPAISMADIVRHVKSRSSKWMHETFPSLRNFAWQQGYGGFTVSTSQAGVVKSYIEGQKVHHRSRDFCEEFLLLLRRHLLAHDEAEVFD